MTIIDTGVKKYNFFRYILGINSMENMREAKEKYTLLNTIINTPGDHGESSTLGSPRFCLNFLVLK